MILYWIRTDVRLDDNPALEAAANLAVDKNEPLVALFVETPEQWEKHDRAPIQIDFLERHLNLVKDKLAELNVPLIFESAKDFNAQIDVCTRICKEHNVTHVFLNQELEINEVNRDSAFKNRLNENDIECSSYESDVVLPKGQVLNKQHEMYRVFTPFKREWLSVAITQGFYLADSKESLTRYFNANISMPDGVAVNEGSITFTATKKDSSNWPLITNVRSELIPDFYERIIVRYPEDRDIPSIEGTSKLSPYLAIGALSPKRLVSQLMFTVPNILDNTSLPEFGWLNQLIWRDFYRNLLFHYPELCKHNNFNKKYDGLDWPNNGFLFKAWKEGKTGYPIVDAAMRQLLETGWMHNRLRMVVASFLTKHLLIDWRLGEQFFAQHLIDVDLANNNGGWQWAAGTGCDAQPYFRIFNPISQSQKFDPDGTFLRKYLPELKNFSNKDIHFPHKVIKSEKIKAYWPAIVDHKTARENALDFYKSKE